MPDTDTVAVIRSLRKELSGVKILILTIHDNVHYAIKSLKECARELEIGASTAATYRARLMEKLKLESTADIIRFALENGITG